jgi:hypothetical protein
MILSLPKHGRQSMHGEKDDTEVTASSSVVFASRYHPPPPKTINHPTLLPRITVYARLPVVSAIPDKVTHHDFRRTDCTEATEINLVIYPLHRPRGLTLHLPAHFSIRPFTQAHGILRSLQAAWVRSHGPVEAGGRYNCREQQSLSTVNPTTPAFVQFG